MERVGMAERGKLGRLGWQETKGFGGIEAWDSEHHPRSSASLHRGAEWMSGGACGGPPGMRGPPR